MKSSKYFLILVFFLALSFFVVFPADAAEITFKADHTGPPSKTESRAMEWMSNYIAKESMGRIKMDVFHLGTLCGRDAHVGFEMTMSGAIEMFIESNIMLVEWEPRYQVILFPFIFKGFDETYKLAKSPFAKEMASWVEPKGMTIIGWWTRPFRQLTNNRNPVRSPEDMKGMKVRVPASPIMLDTHKAFGADPAPMSMGDVYTALQLKTINAQENGLTSIMSNKMYEVCDYLTYWNYIGDLLAVTVNSRWWNNLPIGDRNIIQEAVNKAQDYVYYVDSDSEATLLKELGTKMQVDVLTNEEVEVFRQAAKPVWDKYMPLVGEANVKKVLEIVGK